VKFPSILKCDVSSGDVRAPPLAKDSKHKYSLLTGGLGLSVNCERTVVYAQERHKSPHSTRSVRFDTLGKFPNEGTNLKEYLPIR
jgi:hypothetical protein